MFDGTVEPMESPSATQEEEIAELTRQRDEYKRAYLELLALNKKLERGLLFRGRERDLEENVTQSLLDMLTGQPTNASETGASPARQNVREHERAKPTGRQPLPEQLPRIDVEVVPPEVERQGLDAFEKIGEDVTETVERRPAALVVVRVHRPKFVPKERERATATVVEQASPPELPIQRGLAGPALLANTLVSRWEDHLPLHRLERVYGREGWQLSRSTMCDWHGQLAVLVQPLLAAMWQDALNAPYLCMDATGVLVQELEKCRNAHFFVVAAPESHILFGYSPKHNSAAVDALIKGYKGYLVADAHSVYEHLYQSGDVVEVACWAHTRRYFFKSLGSDPERARWALAVLGQLFAIERDQKSATPERRLEVRQALSRPLAESFFAWCDTESLRVLDETPISKAIQYARNQQAALLRFTEDGRLPMHNNLSERELRREAVGRKNWLFVGSDEGGRTNATFVSLIASCRLHGIDPTTYLRDLLCLLPGWNQQTVLDLSPLHWKTTLARQDVKNTLASNVYRRVALGDLKPTQDV